MQETTNKLSGNAREMKNEMNKMTDDVSKRQHWWDEQNE